MLLPSPQHCFTLPRDQRGSSMYQWKANFSNAQDKNRPVITRFLKTIFPFPSHASSDFSIVLLRSPAQPNNFVVFFVILKLLELEERSLDPTKNFLVSGSGLRVGQNEKLWHQLSIKIFIGLLRFWIFFKVSHVSEASSEARA